MADNFTKKTTEKKLGYNTIESALGFTGKVTPQAINFEEAVLGAIMIDSQAANEVVGTLKEAMFYKEQHQQIFKTIQELYDELVPVDLLTVTDKLRKNKMLESVGGASHLAALSNKVASAANIEYHARILVEKYMLRELIRTCGNIIHDAYDDGGDVIDIVDRAETSLFSIFQDNLQRDSIELKLAVKNAYEEIAQLREKEGQFLGVPSGLTEIDKITGGWQESHLVIIAARPGMGKTALVVSMARNAALDYDKKVAIFSLEMPANQLVHRLLSLESKIETSKISKGELTENEWKQLMTHTARLNTSNLILDDTPALSIFDLRAKCRRLKKKYGIDMVIIDYLQLMRGNTDANKGVNREQEISAISRSLKALAKELNIPIIALSQLSRQVEQRGGSKRPQLSDLRESGSIEQDADQVLFIYRPEYYGIDTFEDDAANPTPSQNMAEIIFAKNRHGQTTSVKVRFVGKYTMFENQTDNVYADTYSSDISANTAFESGGYATMDSKMNHDAEELPDMEFDNGDMPF
ncbi:MAG: replicative DNA helicase [Bacteroidales bacterium]|jgi:replicative DNA helicase|nr:replicative DNA helicase [Bacteroidales bacterium]